MFINEKLKHSENVANDFNSFLRMITEKLYRHQVQKEDAILFLKRSFPHFLETSPA
jgi:hypothetical protein